MGHFRDLPGKNLGVNLSTMEPTYVVTKEDVVQRIKPLLERAEEVFLCTDPDREGEAIAWHLKHFVPEATPCHRATFQEITERAVKRAVASPTELRMPLVNAQQARRVLDRIVGYKLSPELWRHFKGKGALSAGRVQSVATRLVVDREREIEAFVEKVSYKVIAHLEHEEQGFIATLKGKGSKFTEVEKAKAFIERLRGSTFVVDKVTNKDQAVKPQPPFTTSNLQAKAATVLKMSSAQSMQVAQKLYEGGHITYHRTDSFAISKEAQSSSREVIEAKYGKAYLPQRPPVYRSKGNAQEAHECIRPTRIDRPELASVNADEARLYDLIWRQFISSQMEKGIDAVTVVELQANGALFEARGRTERFDGFRRINRSEVQEKSRKKRDEEEEEKQKLPNLEKGDEPLCKKIVHKEVKTRPPARYSEASLIKKLEKEGIGRPSTYASIVGTILKRNYVNLEKRRYHATALGCDVTDFLVRCFPAVMEIGFTRHCESRLDSIGEGDMEWQVFLARFWKHLKGILEQAQMEERTPSCDRCGSPTSFRESKKWEGRFFYCCDPCRRFLEADKDGRPIAKDWIG